MGRRLPAEPAVAGAAECFPVKDAGEPRAGEPHARFDGGALQTEPMGGAYGDGLSPGGKPRDDGSRAYGTAPPSLPRQRSTRRSSRRRRSRDRCPLRRVSLMLGNDTAHRLKVGVSAFRASSDPAAPTKLCWCEAPYSTPSIESG